MQILVKLINTFVIVVTGLDHQIIPLQYSSKKLKLLL